MKKAILSSVMFSVLAAATGCSFAARSPQMYRDDTAALLETKAGDIKACYDQVLQGDAAAQGTVRVQFTVQKDTGLIAEPQVDANGSTAPPALQSCVTNAIAGLKLEPPDQDDGQATFTWEFTMESGAPPPEEAPPMEPPADAPPT